MPGRNPLIDGFGLIAFASLFPILSVMAYAQLSEFRAKIAHGRNRDNTSLKVKREEDTMHFKMIIAFVEDSKTDAVTGRRTGSGRHRGDHYPQCPR